jgi:DNA-binding LacI/PurR family transcriptional regulator
MAAAEAAGHHCALLRAGPTSYATGAEAARRLLAARDRPEAVFCVTDLIACGFMDTARQDFGIRIPEDLCVVGFDDIEQAGWLSYRLTTFAQPLDEMASAIAQLLEHAAEEKTGGANLLYKARPVWRSTVRARSVD